MKVGARRGPGNAFCGPPAACATQDVPSRATRVRRSLFVAPRVGVAHEPQHAAVVFVEEPPQPLPHEALGCLRRLHSAGAAVLEFPAATARTGIVAAGIHSVIKILGARRDDHQTAVGQCFRISLSLVTSFAPARMASATISRSNGSRVHPRVQAAVATLRYTVVVTCRPTSRAS